MKKHILLGALAALVLGTGLACHNTAQGVKEDARENSEKAQAESKKAAAESKDVAQKVSDEAKEAAGKVSEGAQEVGAKVKEGAHEVVTEIDAKKQMVDIKAALMADTTIDASQISVETDADSRTVTLRGHVPSNSQRMAADRIARSKAEGYAIVNQLQVPARSAGGLPPHD
jgi:osmotically-inducible protein OsmY